MRIIEKTSTTGTLAEFTDRVDGEPIIVTDHGIPVAAVLAIQDADLETVSLSMNTTFLQLIERSRASQKAEGGISSDEMRRRLGIRKSKPVSTVPPKGSRPSKKRRS